MTQEGLVFVHLLLRGGHIANGGALKPHECRPRRVQHGSLRLERAAFDPTVARGRRVQVRSRPTFPCRDWQHRVASRHRTYHAAMQTFPRRTLIGKDRTTAMSTVLVFKQSRRDSPSIENGKVAPPRRVANLHRRSREHLTPAEVERLIVAAGQEGRHGLRDSTLVLVAYRHGLRVGELVALRWEQVDLSRGTFHVNRKKNGEAGTPLSGRELRAIRQLKRAYPESP